jgi:hypothetical protein
MVREDIQSQGAAGCRGAMQHHQQQLGNMVVQQQNAVRCSLIQQAGRQAGRRKHVPQQGMCRTLNMMYGMADESASSSAGSTELLRSR